MVAIKPLNQAKGNPHFIDIEIILVNDLTEGLYVAVGMPVT